MTSLTLVRRIKARPSIVFDALTTPEGIACWWGPDGGPVLVAETDPQVGGRFRVRFRMLDGSEHESSGEYLEVVKPERLSMSWHWTGGVEDPGESLVEIRLRAIVEGTELTFTHSRLRNEETRRSHEQGWNGALNKLERHFLPRTKLPARCNVSRHCGRNRAIDRLEILCREKLQRRISHDHDLRIQLGSRVCAGPGP
jgi:uncharacterized protein YndB with AHSA1/START domain